MSLVVDSVEIAVSFLCLLLYASDEGLNLYLRQADGYQILFCVIFPLSGKVPNATCVSIIPGKQFFSRADTSACVSSVPLGGLFMSLTMVLKFDNGSKF